VFAFGGIYPATLILPAIVCALLAVADPPPFCASANTRGLDVWAAVTIGAVLLQLIPLPRGMLRAIDPAAEPVARAVLLVDRGAPLPISIDVSGTIAALELFAGVFVLFLTARAIFERGGVRTIARSIAIIGLLLAGIAIAQSATAHGLMYWHWKPRDEGPDPFGPFVNRNHFATWSMMAIPLLAGYLTAHASAHHGVGDAGPWQHRVASAIDTRVWMLIASASVLIVALAASLSRSGLLGFAGALACGAVLAIGGPRPGHDRRYAPRTGRAGALIAALAALAVVGVATEVGPTALAGRLGASRGAIADRLTIWHDTLPVLRDFWLTGTGAGTYLRSMAVYQRSMPGVIFNQAHNHYLQLAAEGGVLVGLPVLLALWCFARAAIAGLRADRSPMYWVRAGAAAGLFGVAVQSVWETGLTIPANAALAAVLAAVVIHTPVRAGERV
jgi:hypothetical protein